MKADRMEQEAFGRILVGLPDWKSVDSIRRACDEQGFWSEQFIERGLVTAKNDVIRGLVRRVKLKDGEGGHDELVGVIQKINGKKERVYKQLSLFDADDFVQVVGFHTDRAGHHSKEAKRFIRLAIERLGGEMQERFEFMESSIESL